MARKQSDDSFSEHERSRRLGTISKGAFSGPSTPLKEIPTRHGEQWKLERKPQPSVADGTKIAPLNTKLVASTPVPQIQNRLEVFLVPRFLRDAAEAPEGNC